MTGKKIAGTTASTGRSLNLKVFITYSRLWGLLIRIRIRNQQQQ
ncbi:MAG: hypothetical protein ACRD6U_01735 [Nitrososphaeraceae archaeon]